MLRVAGESSNTVPMMEEGTELDKTNSELIAMWDRYRMNQVYNNPVELSLFFAEFTALFGYFYVIVNKDKLITDQKVAKATAELMVEFINASNTERSDNIRRKERSVRCVNEYYLSQVAWAKGCITEMQTLLRGYGDDYKMTGGKYV